MACMTREEMAAVIRSGQVVIYQGRLVASESALPSEAELAQGDPTKVAAAREALQARKAALELEITALDTQPAPVTTPVETPKADDPAPREARAEDKADSKAPSKGK